MCRFGIKSFLCLLLAACCLSHTEALQAEILRLKSTAVVDSSVVRLGDVADVLHADEVETARMQEMILQPAPAQGRTQIITVSQIRSRLQALGVDLSRLELTGRSQIQVSAQSPSEETQVKTATTQKDLQQAEEKVQRALQAWIRRAVPDAGHFTAIVRMQPEDVALIRDHRADGFYFSQLDLQRQTRQPVTLQLKDAQGMVRQANLTCQLKRVPEILAAKYTLNRGTVVRADDLVWMRPEKEQKGITDPRQVIGRELTRTVYQAQPMRSEDLIEVPLVRDGAIVTVYARRGGITVRREMRARGDGAMGDEITLIALEGRDRLAAIVTGYNQAEVNYRPASQLQRSTGIQFISGSTSSAGPSRTGQVQTVYEIQRGGRQK
ncbi:flagellar basal body P-ring formation chaperone FlgA [Gimesia panareensis]|uniref:Flagellar basal body P-ring biosynthesis protein FlgA n=1 Tax=Gimesia panareensis TaxID=2527978 RepID=A0A517Q1X1_9PLAN|nr:flagellar basal body P-ring formation chaperone FlgA [Gimesia panareensis]QDT25627.1 flagellar basal body P-ring biosynthesis protein FlgA [Gimesia panareensis]QDU48573.1 flagellar basal body P-ring biosynthesis protein FlgA [Gimesia panareensis]